MPFKLPQPLDRVVSDHSMLTDGSMIPVEEKEWIFRSSPAHRQEVTQYPLASKEDFCATFFAVKKMRAGSVWFTAWPDGYPEDPFHGFSESGLGFECGSLAVEEHTEQMPAIVQHGKRSEDWPISGEVR